MNAWFTLSILTFAGWTGYGVGKLIADWLIERYGYIITSTPRTK